MTNQTGVARFKGGWALVTGSARKQGLGYAFCRGLAAQGINIVLADMLADDLVARAAPPRQRPRLPPEVNRLRWSALARGLRDRGA